MLAGLRLCPATETTTVQSITSCCRTGTGSHHGCLWASEERCCSSAALGGDGHLSGTALPLSFTISHKSLLRTGTASSRALHPPQPWGAGPWPGQPASWAGGGLWQPEFRHTWLMRLGRGRGEARCGFSLALLFWISECSGARPKHCQYFLSIERKLLSKCKNILPYIITWFL